MSEQTVNVSPPPQAARGLSWKSVTSIFQGDLGQGPVLAALIVMSLYFQSDSHGLFLSPRNLSNLVLQSAVGGVISLAAVMVLLIGEIDLSLAAVSNLCGAVMMTLIVFHGRFRVLGGGRRPAGRRRDRQHQWRACGVPARAILHRDAGRSDRL